jgi:PsbP
VTQQQQGKYYYDYTIAQDGKPEKRLQSVWSMVPGDSLVTLTVQCDQSEYSTYQKEFDAIVTSFKYSK